MFFIKIKNQYSLAGYLSYYLIVINKVNRLFFLDIRLLLPILTTRKNFTINTKLNRQPFNKTCSTELYKRNIVIPNKLSPKVLNEIYNYWYTIPGILENYYSLGILLIFGILLQLFTGVLLVANYEPTSIGAWESIQWIKRDVLFGWWVYSTHKIGVSILFIILYIHIFYGLYTKAYNKKNVWLTGLSIYFIICLIAFLGQCLSWDQVSLWLYKTLTLNLITVPYIGSSLLELVWGGFTMGDATLKRIYITHIALNSLLILLIGLHLRAIHILGINSIIGTMGTYSLEFYPYTPIKDLFIIQVYILIVLVVIIYDPDLFCYTKIFKDTNILVSAIVPEWYFLPFYTLFRSAPNKIDGVWTIIYSISIWLSLPWWMGGEYRQSWSTPDEIVYWITISFIILLGWLGTQPLRSPFLALSLTIIYFYFKYFLYYLPISTFYRFRGMLWLSMRWLRRKWTKYKFFSLTNSVFNEFPTRWRVLFWVIMSIVWPLYWMRMTYKLNRIFRRNRTFKLCVRYSIRTYLWIKFFQFVRWLYWGIVKLIVFIISFF